MSAGSGREPGVAGGIPAGVADELPPELGDLVRLTFPDGRSVIGEWCVREGGLFLDRSESPFLADEDLVAYLPEDGAGVEVAAPAGFWGQDRWPPLREPQAAEDGGYTTSEVDAPAYTLPFRYEGGSESAGDVDGEVWS